MNNNHHAQSKHCTYEYYSTIGAMSFIETEQALPQHSQDDFMFNSCHQLAHHHLNKAAQIIKQPQQH